MTKNDILFIRGRLELELRDYLQCLSCVTDTVLLHNYLPRQNVPHSQIGLCLIKSERGRSKLLPSDHTLAQTCTTQIKPAAEDRARTHDAAQQSECRRLGRRRRAVPVDHSLLCSARQRHRQRDRAVELATSRFDRHDWTDGDAVAEHARHEIRRDWLCLSCTPETKSYSLT